MKPQPPENSERDRARDTKGTLVQWARANLPNFSGCGVVLADNNTYALVFSTTKTISSHDKQTVQNLAGDIEVRFDVVRDVRFLSERSSGFLGLFSFIPKLLGRMRRGRRTNA